MPALARRDRRRRARGRAARLRASQPAARRPPARWPPTWTAGPPRSPRRPAPRPGCTGRRTGSSARPASRWLVAAAGRRCCGRAGAATGAPTRRPSSIAALLDRACRRRRRAAPPRRRPLQRARILATHGRGAARASWTPSAGGASSRSSLSGRAAQAPSPMGAPPPAGAGGRARSAAPAASAADHQQHRVGACRVRQRRRPEREHRRGPRATATTSTGADSARHPSAPPLEAGHQQQGRDDDQQSASVVAVSAGLGQSSAAPAIHASAGGQRHDRAAKTAATPTRRAFSRTAAPAATGPGAAASSASRCQADVAARRPRAKGVDGRQPSSPVGALAAHLGAVEVAGAALGVDDLDVADRVAHRARRCSRIVIVLVADEVVDAVGGVRRAARGRRPRRGPRRRRSGATARPSPAIVSGSPAQRLAGRRSGSPRPAARAGRRGCRSAGS